MARWDGDKLTLEWTAGAPFVELKVWDGAEYPAHTVRMHVDTARELGAALAIAIGEAAPSSGVSQGSK
jgi:hypothetical protein